MTGYLAPEHRGEWTDAKGKLFHNVFNAAEPLPDTHVGSWLTCDTCNPVQVVDPAALPGTATTSSLADLRVAYAEAAAAKKRADEREAGLKAKLKAALTEASGGALRSALHVPGFPPVLLTYSERWTVDSKALKAEQPLVYVQYAKQGTAWTLTEGKADQS